MALLSPVLYGRHAAPWSASPLSFSPWSLLREVEQEIDQLFGEIASEVSAGYPPLDVWYNEKEALVRVAMPGVKKEDLEVVVTGNSLAIKGERKEPELGGAKLVRQERPMGSFGRTIQLPFDLDPDQVEAALKDGVLELRLPRRKEDLPKKLEIKVH